MVARLSGRKDQLTLRHKDTEGKTAIGSQRSAISQNRSGLRPCDSNLPMSGFLQGRFANRPPCGPSRSITGPPGGSEGVVVRGIRRAAYHQPRTPETGVPCCPAWPAVQQVTRSAGGGWFSALHPSPVRSWCRGFFRVIPFSNVFLDRSQGPQGNDAGYFPRGNSRKNRPRAERRRSFWPFFFGEKEKGRKN